MEVVSNLFTQHTRLGGKLLVSKEMSVGVCLLYHFFVYFIESDVVDREGKKIMIAFVNALEMALAFGPHTRIYRCSCAVRPLRGKKKKRKFRITPNKIPRCVCVLFSPPSFFPSTCQRHLALS